MAKLEGEEAMTTTLTKPLKPVRTVRGSTARGALRRRVQLFERRYEMPTAQMRELIMHGKHIETAEIARWLHDANVLARLEAKSTAGSALTHIEKSTRAL